MKPENRKIEIVKAAVTCFAKFGYHATSISLIIEQAKIARGTFYLYFKSKHEIFEFVLDDFISELNGQIKSISLDSGESPALQMRGNVERVVDAILTRPEIAKIIFNEAVGLDETINAKLKDFYAKLLSMISSSIRRGISIGLLRKTDPTIASCIALGALRELVTQKEIFANAKVDRNAMVDGAIDVIFGGLGQNLMA